MIIYSPPLLSLSKPHPQKQILSENCFCASKKCLKIMLDRGKSFKVVLNKYELLITLKKHIPAPAKCRDFISCHVILLDGSEILVGML